MDEQNKLNGTRTLDLCSVSARLERYGVTPRDFWQRLAGDRKEAGLPPAPEYLCQLDRDEKLVAVTAGVLHLLDEYRGGLLSCEAVVETGTKFIMGLLTMQIANTDRVDDPAGFLCRLLIKAIACSYGEEHPDFLLN